MHTWPSIASMVITSGVTAMSPWIMPTFCYPPQVAPSKQSKYTKMISKCHSINFKTKDFLIWDDLDKTTGVSNRRHLPFDITLPLTCNFKGSWQLSKRSLVLILLLPRMSDFVFGDFEEYGKWFNRGYTSMSQGETFFIFGCWWGHKVLIMKDNWVPALMLPIEVWLVIYQNSIVLNF